MTIDDYKTSTRVKSWLDAMPCELAVINTILIDILGLRAAGHIQQQQKKKEGTIIVTYKLYTLMSLFLFLLLFSWTQCRKLWSFYYSKRLQPRSSSEIWLSTSASSCPSAGHNSWIMLIANKVIVRERGRERTQNRTELPCDEICVSYHPDSSYEDNVTFIIKWLIYVCSTSNAGHAIIYEAKCSLAPCSLWWLVVGFMLSLCS